MRCSISAAYSDKSPYIEFQYPHHDEARIKRLQKAGIQTTQQLIEAVEQFDQLIEQAVAPKDPKAEKLRDMVFQAKLCQKGDIQFTPDALAAPCCRIIRYHKSKPGAGAGGRHRQSGGCYSENDRKGGLY